tara:strand:- start:676 stop:1083 length:408 start_codon:yes stop_codon:yes gene_type:complete
MDWKRIVKFDFGEAQGRPRGKKDLPKQFKNPHAKKKETGSGEKVDSSVPTGTIPTNKCDWWPNCKNDAALYCTTCGYKACKQDYDDFDGYHPSRAMDGGGDPSRAFSEIWEDEDSAAMGDRQKKDVGKYPTGKDW